MPKQKTTTTRSTFTKEEHHKKRTWQNKDGRLFKDLHIIDSTRRQGTTCAEHQNGNRILRTARGKEWQLFPNLTDLQLSQTNLVTYLPNNKILRLVLMGGNKILSGKVEA